MIVVLSFSGILHLAQGRQLKISLVAKTGAFRELFINAYCPFLNKHVSIGFKLSQFVAESLSLVIHCLGLKEVPEVKLWCQKITSGTKIALAGGICGFILLQQEEV